MFCFSKFKTKRHIGSKQVFYFLYLSTGRSFLPVYTYEMVKQCNHTKLSQHHKYYFPDDVSPNYSCCKIILIPNWIELVCLNRYQQTVVYVLCCLNQADVDTVKADRLFSFVSETLTQFCFFAQRLVYSALQA